MDLIQGQISKGLVDQLSKQLGGTDRGQTEAAANGILSTLMGALAKNASTPNGASALNAALDRDHDGSIMDDLMGFMTGSRQAQNSSMINGAGILRHVLGGKQNGAIDMIAKMSGLDQSKTGNLMTMLAPLVMGALGKAKQERNLDTNGISDFLRSSVKSASTSRAEMSIVEKFLDQDGDGSVMDDLAGMGMNIFSKFLKR